MAWIKTVAPADATTPLRDHYARIRDRSSRHSVSNLWITCGLDPSGLDALYAHYQALMSDPAPLSTTQAEMIAVAVSATNGCAYSVAHHGPRLARALNDEPLARAVARDYREANLAARDRVLLDHAIALTCEPAERKREDLDRLREYGFDDPAILKATEIAAFFGLVNRIASTLGVEIEPDLEAWEFGAQK
jgi:uncharacterized peroxidase-related enzyme